MKGSKKISDIYREKFKNLEIAPPEDAWENIAASLPGKKRKVRILPLWYKIAGIAAALAVLFLLFNKPFSINEPVKITSDPPSSIPEHKKDSQENMLPEMISEDEEVVKTSRSNEKPKLNKTTKFNRGIRQRIASSEDSTIENKEVEALFTSLHNNPKIKSSSNLSSTFSNLPGLPAGTGQPQDKNKEITEINDLKQNLTNNTYEDKITEEASLSSRFSVTPTAGAIYFDNLGNGNSLDEQFANKEGKGEITMAYGINIAYRISEKIKIRTGFSQIELSHRTQDMSLAAMSKATTINNMEIMTTIAAPSNGILHQRMSFLEIPMEIEYALINNKIGLNLIGGISTLFLDGNNISLNSPVSTTNLGEANNLKNMSFSANIGIGLDYEVFSQFRLKLEPIFKYQLNTFSNISGYNPYYFGIYSGISYKF